MKGYNPIIPYLCVLLRFGVQWSGWRVVDPPDSRWPEQRCISTPCPPQHSVAAVLVARDPGFPGREGGEMEKKKSKPAGSKNCINTKTW